jgi:transposase
MAQRDLRRVERCRQDLEKARLDFEAAIKSAVASGESYRDVAERAGISYQRVAQIVKKP